jgi:DNA-binding transcriptional regulator YdaS (Cro superfamily)
LRSALKPCPGASRMSAIATITICMALTLGLSIPPGSTWMQQVVKLAAKNAPDVLQAQRLPAAE